MVETILPLQGVHHRSLVKELKSHILCGAAKINKIYVFFLKLIYVHLKLTSLAQVCIVRSIRPRRGRNFLSSPNQPQQIILCCSVAVMSDSETPWTAARQASLSFTISQSLLKLMSVESVMPSNHLLLCQPLLLLPSVFPSIRVFYSGLALSIRCPKDWSGGVICIFPIYSWCYVGRAYWENANEDS